MEGQQLSHLSSVAEQAVADRLSTPAIIRRVLQGVGGGASVILAALMPWSEFTPDGITVGSVLLPNALLALFGLVALVGLAFFAASVWGLMKRLPRHACVALVCIATAGALSLAGMEYGYLRTGGLTAYEYRPAFRLLCYTVGIALLACSVPEELGARFAFMIRRRIIRIRTVVALSLAVTAAGAFVGAVVLDGMPHIIDGTSYLLQARTYASGELATQPPLHPALFAGELMHFRISEAGYFSKYPPGWPALLAPFDAMGLPWLANAMLAGMLVLLTYLLVAERGDKRLAGLSAVIVALCPWLWFNAGTMMSHLASAVWLWLFLWLLIRAVRIRSHAFMFLAGLALGAAVLTRPADAAFFALPCVIAAICWMIRKPDTWLTRMPLVAIGALPGTLAYLWINQQLAGTGGTATYGGEHASVLFSQSPDSIGHALAWLHQGWVGLSSYWFAGAVPAAVLLLCGAVFGRRALRGQWLVFACAASLFICYGIFVFGGRAWVGPRWYVPLIPAVALLIAAGFDAASQAGRMRTPGGVLAAGYLRSALVACVVVFAVAVPAHTIELFQRPPHGIDGTVVRIADEIKLTNAVVALPTDGLDPTTGMPNYKRGIAGMWSMQVPFEDSPVIYVAAVEGWQAMAEEAWPDRHLLMMSSEAGDWVLTEVANRTERSFENSP